jgi:hypothetical protein
MADRLPYHQAVNIRRDAYFAKVRVAELEKEIIKDGKVADRLAKDKASTWLR